MPNSRQILIVLGHLGHCATMDFYKNTLFIVFVAIFVISAIITLLGITGVLKIERRYLNTLFTSLIIGLVGAVISMFNGISWDSNKKDDPIEIGNTALPVNTDPPGPKADPKTPDDTPAKEDLAAVVKSPDLLRTFFVGRWAVEQRFGANSGGSVIDYRDDGTFNGEETGFNGGIGMKQPVSGNWSTNSAGDGKFRLSLSFDDGRADFNGTFRIFDHDHIQNVDVNYMASRVTN